MRCAQETTKKSLPMDVWAHIATFLSVSDAVILSCVLFLGRWPETRRLTQTHCKCFTQALAMPPAWRHRPCEFVAYPVSPTDLRFRREVTCVYAVTVRAMTRLSAPVKFRLFLVHNPYFPSEKEVHECVLSRDRPTAVVRFDDGKLCFQKRTLLRICHGWAKIMRAVCLRVYAIGV